MYNIKTYSTGRYGIVDLYYRHIWLNCQNETIAHEISRVFWSKATSVVFDLSWFDNYSDQQVDSSVSLNWKIPVCSDLSSMMLKMSLRNPFLLKTYTEYESKLLVNEPNHCNLTHQQQLELQNQMMLLISIFECTRLHCPEYSTPERESMLIDLRNIFSTEIRTDIIRDQLCDLASTYVSAPNDASVHLLKLLGKMYA